MKKFLKYIITLVIVFMVSMATTVKLLSPNMGEINNVSQIADGSGSSPAMEKLLKYFQSLNSFEVWGEINLNTNENNLKEDKVYKTSETAEENEENANKIIYVISADIRSLENAKIDAQIEYYNNVSDCIKIEIIFDGNVLYVNAQDKKVKVENATIKEVLGLVLSNLSLDGGLDSLLEKFDISKIMLALGQMEETQNDDSTITSTLKLENIATVDIITDNNYDLKSLNIYDCNLIKAPFSMNVNIEKKDECQLQIPEDNEEYLNITTLTSSIKNTLALKSYTILPTLEVNLSDGKVLILDLGFARAKDGQYSIVINLNINKLNAKFIVLGNDVYAEINSVKLKINVCKLKDLIDEFLGDNKNEQTDKIVNKLEDIATQNKPEIENKIQELKQTLENITITEWLKSVTNFNLNSNKITAQIDFSKIELLNFNAVINFELLTNSEKQLIENVKLDVNDLSGANLKFNLSISDETYLEQVEEENYLSLPLLEDSIRNTLSLQELTLNSDFDIEFNNGKVLNVQLKVVKYASYVNLIVDLKYENNFANLIIINNEVYANINSLKIKADINKLSSLIKEFIGNNENEKVEALTQQIEELATSKESELKAQLNDFKNKLKYLSISEIISAVKLQTFGANAFNLVVDLSKFDALNVQTKVTLELNVDEQKEIINSLKLWIVDLQNINLNTNINIKDYAEEIIVNENEYLSLQLLEDSIRNTLSLQELTLNSDFDIEFNNGKVLNVQLKVVKYASYVNLIVDLKYENNFANLIIINNEVYANINSLKIKADINKLSSLIKEFIGNNENEKVEALTQQIEELATSKESELKAQLNDFKNKLKYLSISEIISAVKLQTFGANAFNLVVDLSKFDALNVQTKVTLELNVDEQKEIINSLKLWIVDLQNINLNTNVNIKDYAEEIAVNHNEYLSLSLLEDGIKNSFSLTNFTINSSIEIVLANGNAIVLDLSFARAEDGKQTIVLNLSVKDLTAKFIIINNNVFAEIKGIKVKLDITQLKSLINKLIGDAENEQIEKLINQIEDFATGKEIEINNQLNNLKQKIQTLTIGELLKAININNYGTNEFSFSIDLSKLSELNLDAIVSLNLSINEEKQLLDNLKANIINLYGTNTKLNISVNDYASLAQVNANLYLNLVEVTNNLLEIFNFKTISANLTATVYDGNSAIYELISSINAELNSYGFNTIEDKIMCLINSNYLSIVASLGGNAQVNGKIVLYEDELYINVNNSYIKISRTDLYELIGLPKNADEYILNELTGLNLLEQLKDIFKNNETLTVDEIIEKLKLVKIECNSNMIDIVLDSKLINSDRALKIKVGFIDNQISSVEINGLKIADKYVNINLDLKLNSEINKVKPQEEYFNLTEGYQTLLDLLSLNEAKLEAEIGIYETLNPSLIYGGVQYNESFKALIEKISNPNARTLDLYSAIETFNLENNLDLKIHYQQGVLYVEYKSELGDNPLKVKINKENINESIVAICSVFLKNQTQTDTIVSSLDDVQGFLEGAGIETLIDLNSLSLINIINNLKGKVQTDKNVDFNQVISLLSGITINASGIDLTLSANTINANSDMRIMATFYNNSINSVSVVGLDGGLIANYLTGLGIDLNNKFIDFNLKIDTSLSSVTKVNDVGYINLNGVDEILKSASNAINNNKSFKLSGKINAGLIIGSSTYNIDDVQVNIIANLKDGDLELLIDLPSIPVILPGIVFKPATRGRNAQIYYYNGKVYIYRFDNQLINRNDKEYKYSCSLDWCFANLADVLSYALGFTDMITGKIRDSINSVDNEAPTNVIENIIKDYSNQTNGTQSNYSVKISGAALAQKSMLGDMTFKIVTNNQSHTIQQIGIDMMFVDLISLNGMLNFETFANTQTINFNTSNYEFKG